MQHECRFFRMRRRHVAMAVALSAMPPGAAFGAEPPSQASARLDPERHEVLDRASAQSLANALVPIIADDVVDGGRMIVRALPTGGDVGLFYRFRLRAEAVPLQPFCRMRIVTLSYEFAEQQTFGAGAVQDLDLLALKRAGNLGRGGIETHSVYLPLEPAPDTEDERRSRCEAADRDATWYHSADNPSFSSELQHLAWLREALSGSGPGPRLRCWRDGEYGCPVSKEMILDVIGSDRRAFQAIRLADRSEWAQFTYYENPRYGEDSDMQYVIIERRSGEIASITLAHGILTGTVI